MITILSTLDNDATAQDYLWISCISDNSGQTDFKYIFDVYIDNTQKIRVKKFPEPSNGLGYFDASVAVRNNFTYDWFYPVQTVFCAEPGANEAYVNFDVRIGEDYSGVTTLNDASATTRTYNFRQPYTGKGIRNINAKLNKFITNRPLSIESSLGENLFIPLFTDASGLTLKVDTYDQNNNLIQNYVHGSAHSVSTGFLMLNISSTSINTYTGATVIDSSVKFYDAWFNSLDKVRVYLKCNGNYTPINLHFMNEWGHFDTAKFGLVSKLTMDVDRKSYSKRDYSLVNASPSYYNQATKKFIETKINYGAKYDHSYKLTMDAPTDAEYVWLADLINSPQVYAEIDGYYYPVTIKNTNYEYSTILNNRLRVLEIDIELNQTRYSHQR